MNPRKSQLAQIFIQLQGLRESVRVLEQIEERTVHSLRGHQTVSANEAVHASFVNIQDSIANIEEVLATVAEATGDIAKL